MEPSAFWANLTSLALPAWKPEGAVPLSLTYQVSLQTPGTPAQTPVVQFVHCVQDAEGRRVPSRNTVSPVPVGLHSKVWTVQGEDALQVLEMAYSFWW